MTNQTDPVEEAMAALVRALREARMPDQAAFVEGALDGLIADEPKVDSSTSYGRSYNAGYTAGLIFVYGDGADEY